MTAPEELNAQCGDVPLAPMLRLRRTGDAQQRSLRLAAGKCTVGSSPQCQVCIPSPEVRPLQFLITLEANAASVTRWATGVQLNGRDFSKAALNNGDRLTIGSWELQFDRGGNAGSFDFHSQIDGAFAYKEEVAPITAPGSAGGPPSIGTNPDPVLSDPRPKAEPATVGESPSSSLFQSSLVQHLWTANFQARRRAKALINGIRAARFHADAMAADLSAMETELDLARAAYDSHIVNDDRLQQELEEHRRQHEARLTPLIAEITSLKHELGAATAALATQISEYESLAAELAAAENAPAAPAVDDTALSRVAELENALVKQSQQLESITLQLQAAQEEQERLAQRYHAETERGAALEAALAEMRAGAEEAATATARLESATPQPFEPTADVWQNVQPVEEAPPPEARAPASWAAFEPATQEPIAEPTALSTEVTKPESAASPWTSPTAVDAFDEPEPEVAEVPAVEIEHAALAPAAVEQPEIPTPPPAEGPAWAAPPAEQPVAEYSSTSFIDKYRHLLEEDDASSAPLPGRGGPMIDDEFLSPAKAQTCASPADESDEALEAYMANMMRRVKSSSSSFAGDPPPRAIQDPSASVLSKLLQSPGEPAATDPQPEADFLSDQPLSFEELKQATRKVPLASDLAALREIANSTARTAIATHSHRQSRESAITKIIVAITATVSAGYLMASAPALDTWQFWAGAATCAVGIVAAVQVLVLERRGRRGRQ
ncbi:MAG TPA: FHA domain-containing protein [Lacipirellula sp.]